MNCKGNEIFSFLRSISLEIDAVGGKSRNEGLDGVIVSSLLRRAMPCKLWSSCTTPRGMWSGARRLGEAGPVGGLGTCQVDVFDIDNSSISRVHVVDFVWCGR